MVALPRLVFFIIVLHESVIVLLLVTIVAFFRFAFLNLFVSAELIFTFLQKLQWVRLARVHGVATLLPHQTTPSLKQLLALLHAEHLRIGASFRFLWNKVFPM